MWQGFYNFPSEHRNFSKYVLHRKCLVSILICPNRHGTSISPNNPQHGIGLHICHYLYLTFHTNRHNFIPIVLSLLNFIMFTKTSCTLYFQMLCYFIQFIVRTIFNNKATWPHYIYHLNVPHHFPILFNFCLVNACYIKTRHIYPISKKSSVENDQKKFTLKPPVVNP